MTIAECKRLKPREGRKLVVIGPNVWGSSDKTGSKAYANASSPREFVVYDCHIKTYVSRYDGTLMVDGEDNPEKLTADELFVKLGSNLKSK